MPEFPFEAVLFDMDGTITDNAHFHMRAWQEFLQRGFGYSLAPDDHRVHGGKTKYILESILERPFSQAEALELHLEKEALYRELARGQIAPLPGLQAYLEWLLARKVKLALVTSADTLNAEFVLEALGLESVFVTRVLGDDVQRGKPDPEPFLLGAARVKVPAARCLAHEDSIAGVQSAVAAGMSVCGLTTWFAASALKAAGAGYAVADYGAWLEVWR